MNSMRRDDVTWIVVVTLIAVTINPMLKFIGLLPADVFRNLGISFPGQPQIVFGPLMAFLLLALFLKTGSAMIFPVIGFLRALSLSFVFPANVEHSGTLLAAIAAGGAAALLLNNPNWTRSHVWLSLLAGLYAGLYAAFNYLSTVAFGPVDSERRHSRLSLASARYHYRQLSAWHAAGLIRMLADAAAAGQSLHAVTSLRQLRSERGWKF